tara:strand:- start:202 stop:432 length:231 start_codon:yes stop_codon:yes gene_type:complete
MSDNSTIQAVKDWFSFVVAVVATVAGVIFWVQTINDDKFSIVNQKITALEKDIEKIETKNNKILRVLGRLEGKLLK